jgi:hypothetical protein
MTMLFQLSAPLSPSDRSQFLARVAHRLRGRDDVGDGLVNRIAREVVTEFRRAVGEPPRVKARWQRRGGGIRASAED